VKRSNLLSALSPVLVGIALATVTPISYAARDVANETQTGLTQAVKRTTTASRAQSRQSELASPLTLYLEDANGKAFRLVQVPGTGWQYADGWKSSEGERNSPLQKTAFASDMRSMAANAAVEREDPLTVFIDGPSGFAFVWKQDEGWKFVGKIANVTP
jgi:hypothetical protein